MKNLDFFSLVKATEKINKRVLSENRDLQYKSVGDSLIDLNFSVSCLRNRINSDEIKDIDDLFLECLSENKEKALQWLLYLRDIYKGMGEREAFRHFMRLIRDKDEDLFNKIVKHIKVEDYGRWDDLIYVLDLKNKGRECNKVIIEKIKKQLQQDILSAGFGDETSLLAKWLPSCNTSSYKTRKYANYVRSALGFKARDFRRILSNLRRYLDVVEVEMSERSFGTICYEEVPAKAFMKYKKAFERNDMDRYLSFLEYISTGKKKVNAKTLFLYEIVKAYRGSLCGEPCSLKYDELLESMWKNQERSTVLGNTLVVRDGSGSMMSEISRGVSALAVGDSLTIYFSELCNSYFKNKMITFSANPEVVDFSQCESLNEKLAVLEKYNDCFNTDIESVFKLVLDTAIKNKLKQEDLPDNILIVSDMQFDCFSDEEESCSVIDHMKEEYKKFGYKLPRLIFWNLSSFDITIPTQENENGIAFISGFSKNLVKLVVGGIENFRESLDKALDQYNIPEEVLN
jgi:hypothetical protein